VTQSTQAVSRVDRPLFIATLAAILLVSIPIIGFHETAGAVISQLFTLLTQHFGVFYIWYGCGAVVILIWLAFGKYGDIKLSDVEHEPEFSLFSWIGMLFSAGVGAGLLYWAVIEWGFYIDSPARGFAARSTEAIEYAAAYGVFHWGITGWAIFCLPTLAIAYPYYVRKVPYLRLSTACVAHLPNGVNSKRGRFIDFIYMINLIGGSGTSLGLATPVIAASLASIFGITHDFALEVAVVVLCVAIFGTSAFLGLSKGIKRLADLNVFAALALLFFVLAVGPTLFILKMGTNSVGLVLQEFIRFNTWTDPVESSGFVESWTVFYWAWWIAYGPFVGIFVTRISRGRTIRSVILNMLLWGSLGAALFFIIFGNYAMYLDINNILNVTGIMSDQSPEAAITQVFLTLPAGEWALILFALVAIIFVATTYDSASYTLASVATDHLHAGAHPARWHRIFWAVGVGILPCALMFIDGGIQVMLSTTIVASLPLLVVGVIMTSSLLKMLREDYQLYGCMTTPAARQRHAAALDRN
jgi:BCCT family betaine/carnitine transporter